jgi:hypothetical protein
VLSVEADQFIKEHIMGRWPRWNPTNIERSDWRRILSRVDSETAEEAIIRTKEDSKTIMWPVLYEFKRKLGVVIGEFKKQQKDTTPSDPLKGWTPCYALNMDNGKWQEVMAPEGHPDGCRVAVAEYLRKWDMDPTDYIIYIGNENFQEFSKTRHEIVCRLNPKIAEHTKRLRENHEKSMRLKEIIEDLPF